MKQIRSTPKNAGTYHVATGTWTRPGGSLASSTTVIYNNTAPIAYFIAGGDNSLSPYSVTDTGRVPSLSDTGDGDSYTVDGIEMGYCTSAGIGPNLGLTLAFDHMQVPCSGPGAGTAGNVAMLVPSGSAPGSFSCWVMTIDLEGTPAEFSLIADGDGTFDNSADLDSFGFSLTFSGQGPNGNTGPIISGDPVACPFGNGTSNFGYGAGCGTGLGQTGTLWVEDPGGGTTGCLSGGYPTGPWLGFYLRLFGESNDLDGPESYCTPASGNSVSASGAVLTSAGAFGTSAATFDVTDIPNQPGLLYAGPIEVDLPFGCGRRCVGGVTTRGSVVTPSGNQIMGTGFDMSPFDLINIQYYYRDPAHASQCGSSWNLSNALRP